MKKIFAVLLFISIFSLVITPILAKEKEDSDKEDIKERILAVQEERDEDDSSKAGKIESKRTENRVRVRNAILARWTAYNKLIVRSGQLLDKLQIRIDRATAAGKDTTEATNAMTDARAKLADAKSKMDVIKSLSGKDLDKNGFKEVQRNLQAVHKDLNIIKQDAAKIISNLKSYNASTKSAELRSTTSADKKD